MWGAIFIPDFAFLFGNLMKNYNTIFDLCLLETILSFFFSALLYIFDDSHSVLLFYISIISLIITLILGLLGYFLKLFKVEDPAEEY